VVSVLPGVVVVDDEVLGLAVGLKGVEVCIGEGDGSGVLVALLEEMPGVWSATRGV